METTAYLCKCCGEPVMDSYEGPGGEIRTYNTCNKCWFANKVGKECNHKGVWA